MLLTLEAEPRSSEMPLLDLVDQLWLPNTDADIAGLAPFSTPVFMG